MDKERDKPILVPVDFSSHSEAALLKACELGDCMKRPILVLHVVHDPGEMPGYYQRIAKKKQLLRIEDIAEEMLNDFLARLIKKYPREKQLKQIEKRLVIGLPVTRILEVAQKSGAYMVVMGSQGRTGLNHLLLGSKAEQVVRLCPVPVTIVKSD
ncbi:MAG: universal stress protein [Gammaproteobacteria bacterium]|nr:universal stress protein [Gammaproteobacteria bacterium]